MVEGKDKTKKEFDELLLEVRKVTRVTTGGRRMSFRATVLAGNKKGKIGLGVSKGVDVTSAVKKAANEAYKNMFVVPITKDKSVPYLIINKYKSCIVKIIPATQGTGLKAGSSVRSVLELAGYENILSKIIGSNNKLNNAIASINALIKYKHSEYFTTFDKNKDKNIATNEVIKNTESDLTTEKKENIISEKKDITKKATVKTELNAKLGKSKKADPIIKKTIKKQINKVK